jgi:hypothetical protein
MKGIIQFFIPIFGKITNNLKFSYHNSMWILERGHIPCHIYIFWTSYTNMSSFNVKLLLGCLHMKQHHKFELKY